jgi:hypothetical protein
VGILGSWISALVLLRAVEAVALLELAVVCTLLGNPRIVTVGR